ncbi:MAG: hypothetical protein J6T10_10470 [Methanobrevibacter sp.]|nr:hypothetical protein [Methanobrevibacter sp.]
MKRKMLAGLVLLNLCVISLDVTAGEVSISNQEVLDQLVDLRNFIDEKRDFTKQSAKGLKPVAVQYRSSALKVDGIVYCNLSFNTDALHLSIAGYSVQADGTPLSLIINVVYEWTEYVGYTIKSAKINATKSFAVDGASFGDDVTIDGDLDVDGDISGDSFDGDTQLEKIKDINNNARFIEWDLTPTEQTGVEYSFAKASLSGTHLMIVIAGTIANATALSSFVMINESLPSWVMEKIVPVSSAGRIDSKSFYAFGDDNSVQSINSVFDKVDNKLKIITTITATANRGFRIQYDLLIDNPQE